MRKGLLYGGVALALAAGAVAWLRSGKPGAETEAERARTRARTQAANRERGLPIWFGQDGARGRRIAGRVVGGPAQVALRSRIGVLATIDATAEFDLGVWPPAEYALVARAPGKTAARLSLDARDPTAKTEGLELVLGPCLATLHGTVRDASGGVIAGAQLLADRAGVAESGAGGDYELCVRPGRPTLEVTADGYGGVSLRPEVYGRVRRDIALTPEAVIVGRVVHEDGAPAAEAEVQATVSRWKLDDDPPSRTLAGDDGRFRLAGLAGGRYALTARDERGATVHPAEVALAAGETTAEITLVLGATSTVRGRVMSRGKPVAGAEVEAAGVSARSQEDGGFVLSGVPRGETALSALPYQVLSPETLEVVDPEQVVSIEVERQGSIAGRVVAGGKPVAGAAVWARGPGRGANGESGADGSFRLEGLAEGRYRLGAESKEAGAFARDEEIALAAAEDKTGVTIDMDLAGEISGVVVDQHGAPVAGVFVMFNLMGGNDYGEGVTAPDGSFSARQLSGGGHYAVKVAPGRRSPHMLPPAEGDSHPIVEVPGGRSRVTGVRIPVRLDRLVLAGRVVSSKGLPVPDAKVRASGSEARGGAGFFGWWELPTATTDADGAFEIRDLLAGSYDVQASSGAGSEAILEGVEAGRRDLVIRLDEPGGIDVHLVDFPPGAEVLATRGSRTGGPARSLLQGDVHRVRGLVPGDYLVIAQAGGHAASQRVTVSPGAIAEVTLKSPGTTEISVRVTEFPGGAPIPGMTCKIAPVVDEEFGRIDAVREGKTDGAGRLTVTGPAGEVVVACGKRGKEWLSNPITGQGHVEVRAVAFMPPPYEAFFGVMLSMDSVLTAVVPGSPAERAGLRTGDEVVAIDGAETRGEGWLVNLFLHTRTPGTLVRFGLSRGGSRLELPVTAGSRDD